MHIRKNPGLYTVCSLHVYTSYAKSFIRSCIIVLKNLLSISYFSCSSHFFTYKLHPMAKYFFWIREVYRLTNGLSCVQVIKLHRLSTSLLASYIKIAFIEKYIEREALQYNLNTSSSTKYGQIHNLNMKSFMFVKNEI